MALSRSVVKWVMISSGGGGGGRLPGGMEIANYLLNVLFTEDKLPAKFHSNMLYVPSCH